MSFGGKMITLNGKFSIELFIKNVIRGLFKSLIVLHMTKAIVNSVE